MGHHITINGHTLCDHLGTIAGHEDWKSVQHEDASQCQSHKEAHAREIAAAWKETLPHATVQVVHGACPRLLTLAK